MTVSVKKSLPGVLILVLVLSVVLAGCAGGNNNASSSPSASTATESSPSSSASEAASETPKSEPLNISIFYGGPGQNVPEDNKIFKKIKDELGVTLKEEFLVGDIEQKLGVMIAGGEYPDMISASPKLVAAKAVIPLEDLIEQHGPNLKKHYEKFLNMMKDSSDGHIYWLPNYGVFQGKVNGTYYSGPAFWIQKAVLKEYSFPKLTTLDDYFNLIEQYRTKYPEIDGQPTIGFTTLAFDWRTFGLKNAPQHLAGYPNDGGVTVDNNVAQIFADKDIAKKYYQKLNDVNAKELMDREAFTQNYDQYLAKLSSGRVLGMFDQHWNFGPAEDSLTTQDKSDRTYVGIPLVYDPSIKDYYRDLPPLNLNNGFGISVDAKDPVGIIKFLDALMDEKWQKTLSWGIEGEDYQIGADGKFFRTPEQRAEQDDPAWKLMNKAEKLYGYMPKFEGTYSDGNAGTPGDQPDEYFEKLRPIEKEMYAAYNIKMPTEFFSQPSENRVSYPAWNIDLIEGSPAKIAETKLNDLALKYLPKAIMSKPENFSSVWDDYVKQIGKVDVKAYEDRVNEQLKWRLDNWGK